MEFNKHDITRNACMLKGKLAKRGYDWWWHSFTGVDEETGGEKAFFIEFFVCNPDLAEPEPVLGQLPENQFAGKKPSYLMVKAGCWGKDARQLHRFFSWNDISVSEGVPFSIIADDCYASENKLCGSVSITPEEAAAHPEWMCDAGEMSWELAVDKQIAFNVGYGAGDAMRAVNAFEMYWHAEGMKTLYSGTVTFGGRRYTVTPETSYGYADKNWGGDFTSPWIWLSSNCMESRITGKKLENSVFDIGGGRPRVFGVSLDRILLGAFYYEGREFEFNFSKVWTRPKTVFRCFETDIEIVWHIRQYTPKYEMRTCIHCRKDEMLFVNYEAPDGSKQHNRLWNGGTGKGRIKLFERKRGKLELIDDINVSHVGCEYGEFC